jgi:sortase (surface protein transpeptidase)
VGTVEHIGHGAGRISGDLGHLIPSPRPRVRPPAPPQKDPVRTAVRTFGEVLITLGMVVLLFVVYEVYWTDVVSAGKQRDATSALDDNWKAKTDDPERQDHFQGLGEGDGFAKMYIPAFGADFHFTIVEGTTAESLEIGPGHYTHTAYPGEVGNFSVAGHRVGKGAPFNDINLISSCDAIVVETRNNWFVYRALPQEEEKPGWAEGKGREARCKGVSVLGGPYQDVVGQQVVLPTNGSVVAPVPGSDTVPSAGEQVALMTLTTCHPRFSDKERLIVHSVLVKQWQKDPAKPDWTPPELKETV